MEQILADFFATNEIVLIAVYGQAFFVLGLAVALQWRRESRLELARSVPLLATFGLVEAFAIWGDIFIPQQATLLPVGDLARLQLWQLLLMLVAATFLLHFGLRLNWDSPWTPRLPWMLAAAGSTILLISYANGLLFPELRLLAEQAIRPIFVFSGAMLAAWGMRRTATQVEAMGLPDHIVSWLRVAGLSLGAYAIFGGLMVPLSTEQVPIIRFTIIGMPLALPRLMAIAVLAWAMIQALTIFRLELQRAMEEMGRLRALSSDRQRIGRELHDGTIQAIYGAGLLLENARSCMRDNPDTADQLFQESMGLLNKTIEDIRRYIFELGDSEGQLAEALGMLVNECRNGSEQHIEYRLEGTLPRVPADHQNHLLKIAREAISNAIKHSHANHIVVSLSGQRDELVLTVVDDGRGLPPGGAYRPGGRGVPNLRARATLLGGTLNVLNRPRGGLSVELVVPYNKMQSSEKSKEGLNRHATSENPAG